MRGRSGFYITAGDEIFNGDWEIISLRGLKIVGLGYEIGIVMMGYGVEMGIGQGAREAKFGRGLIISDEILLIQFQTVFIAAEGLLLVPIGSAINIAEKSSLITKEIIN